MAVSSQIPEEQSMQLPLQNPHKYVAAFAQLNKKVVESQWIGGALYAEEGPRLSIRECHEQRTWPHRSPWLNSTYFCRMRFSLLGTFAQWQLCASKHICSRLCRPLAGSTCCPVNWIHKSLLPCVLIEILWVLQLAAWRNNKIKGKTNLSDGTQVMEEGKTSGYFKEAFGFFFFSTGCLRVSHWNPFLGLEVYLGVAD